MHEELDDEDEKPKQLIASNFGRLKNDPAKQAKLIEEYEKLCGVQHGGDRKSNGHNVRLKTQEDVAKEFGVDVRTLRRLKQFGKLAPEVQEAVKNDKFSVTSAVKVVGAMSVTEQVQLINSLPEAKQTLTQVELGHIASRSLSNPLPC